MPLPPLSETSHRHVSRATFEHVPRSPSRPPCEGDPTPYTADPNRHAKDAGFAAYRRAHVDAMELVIRGGTHYEWSYAPSPAFPATLRGIDLAAWYAQAWFDKYLRRARSADRRLLTDRWRADGPEAAVDRRRDGNAFSFYYPSEAAIHRAARRGRRTRRPGRLVVCRDLRAGCRALVPRGRDGYRGEYSYFRARGG